MTDLTAIQELLDKNLKDIKDTNEKTFSDLEARLKALEGKGKSSKKHRAKASSSKDKEKEKEKSDSEEDDETEPDHTGRSNSARSLIRSGVSLDDFAPGFASVQTEDLQREFRTISDSQLIFVSTDPNQV